LSYDQYFFEGNRLVGKGKLVEALPYFEKSAERYYQPDNTMVMIAYVKKQLGDRDSARAILEEVAARDDYFLPAKYNLANIYIQEKEPEKAVPLLQSIYDLLPEFGEAWYYLITTKISSGDTDDVVPLIEAFIKKYDGQPEKQGQVDRLKSMLTTKE
jgi:tetratricopeptide (TPR) repeat protein